MEDKNRSQHAQYRDSPRTHLRFLHIKTNAGCVSATGEHDRSALGDEAANRSPCRRVQILTTSMQHHIEKMPEPHDAIDEVAKLSSMESLRGLTQLLFLKSAKVGELARNEKNGRNKEIAKVANTSINSRLALSNFIG